MKVAKITREYRFTWAEIKQKLGIVGSFEKLELWRGRSPNEEKAGVNDDGDVYSLITEETQETPEEP